MSDYAIRISLAAGVLVAVFVSLSIVVVLDSNRNDECISKNGFLVKSNQGYVCVDKSIILE